jgi:hypothetical protein
LCKLKLPISQYVRFTRQGKLLFLSSLTLAYVNTDVPKCWRNSLVCAAERVVFIYQTTGAIIPKSRYSIILFVTTNKQTVLHDLLFSFSHCLQIYVLGFLCIYQPTSSLRWKSTLSPGTYWTASVHKEYNMQLLLTFMASVVTAAATHGRGQQIHLVIPTAFICKIKSSQN